MNPSRRRLTFFALVALLGGGLIADAVIAAPPAPVTGPSGPSMPALAPTGSLGSTWYCPATTAVDNGLADARVVVVNPSGAILTGTVLFVPSEGPAKRVPVSVSPRSRTTLRSGDAAPARFTAALVQLDGAEGAVEQQAVGSLGEADAPCATHASGRWYFAAGSTAEDNQLLVSLFNPFPGDAVIDMAFATDTGPSTPGDLQGLVVPGGGLTVVNIGDHVRRRNFIATSVSVRSGAVVADKIQLSGMAGTAARGITLTPGAPAAGTTWYFPDGITGDGITEHYEIYDPTPHDAEVLVTPSLDRGSASPFDLNVPAGDRISLAVNGQSRIPPTVGHAVTVASVNGVPVVAERIIVESSPHVGMSGLLGAPRASAHWVFGTGAASAAQQENLVAFNPGTAPLTLTVTALQRGVASVVAGLHNVVVAPGQRTVMDLGAHGVSGGLIAVVDASGPVVAERVLLRIGAPGIGAALGVPAA